jgi:glycosyltransferase involved in cell wall biosynthesis
LSLNTIAALHAVFLGNYDLVNVHHVEAAFIYPLLRLRYRVVGTCHGLAYWRAKWSPVAKFIMRMMDSPFARLSNLVTCVSSRDSEYFRSRFGRECMFIRVGVNLGFQVNTEQARLIEARYGLSPGEYLLFAAGRIDPTKGAHMAIEAQKRLNKPVPLLIVGDESHAREYCSELRKTAAQSTYFHPLIEDPGILLGVMADARCLVFPSFMEAMSSILLEAGSVGLPVLCSDIPENVAVMQDNAVYFESENVDSLAEKMQWAVDHPDEMSQMGQRARKRIREQHDWDAIVGQYVDAFRSVSG